MSVLIKGMEMPKENSALIVLIYSDGRVFTGRENDDEYSAVEVATPHGRLLDENELVKSIHNDWDDVIVWDECGVTTANEFERLVYEQPTIIEAEEGEEE